MNIILAGMKKFPAKFQQGTLIFLYRRTRPPLHKFDCTVGETAVGGIIGGMVGVGAVIVTGGAALPLAVNHMLPAKNTGGNFFPRSLNQSQ